MNTHDPSLWPEPYEEVDGDTARIERDKADQRLERAATGEIRTGAIIERMRGLLDLSHEMHATNHYVERLRPIFRGTNNAA